MKDLKDVEFRKILGHPLTPNWKDKKPQQLSVPVLWDDEPLCVRVLEGRILLYVSTFEHPKSVDKKPRQLMVMPSGLPLPKGYSFVDSIVNGPWAWHVFIEDKKKKKSKKKQTKKRS